MLVLPPELLSLIFEFATDNPVRYIDKIVELPAFEQVSEEERELQRKEALQTKYALTLTSPYFRALTARLMYEDIWIHHGADELLSVLQKPIEGDSTSKVQHELKNIGMYVRSISLCVKAPETVIAKTQSILECCPNVRIFSRIVPPDLTDKEIHQLPNNIPVIENIADSFKKLHRIDWSNTLAKSVPAETRSPSFIWGLSTLRVLTLGADNFPYVPSFFDDDDLEEDEGDDDDDEHGGNSEESRSRNNDNNNIIINLPNVHTLRISAFDALGDPSEAQAISKSVHLPALRRLVVGSPAGFSPLLSGILGPYTANITTVELGFHVRFYVIDGIQLALDTFPNITTLHYPIFNTIAIPKNSNWDASVNNSEDGGMTRRHSYPVRFIGLSAACTWAHGPYEPDDESSWRWMQLSEHFDSITSDGTQFTNLKTIKLYGSEWNDFLTHDPFLRLLEKISSKGINIEYPA